MNTIYKISNLINGKVYVGQTIQGLRQRQKEHICRFNRGERDHLLYKAFRKHGLDNFSFEEICSVLDERDLNAVEQEQIAFYNSYERGYNMTEGGYSVSPETREKLRASMQGRKITWYDKIRESRVKNISMDRTIKYHLLKHGESELIVHNLKQFCKDNNVNYNSLKTSKTTGNATRGYLLLESSTTSSFERRA
jgi:group I intron endonuclease